MSSPGRSARSTTKVCCGGNDHNSRKDMVVPSSILLQFFRDATAKLHDYPLSYSTHDNTSQESGRTPPSLQAQRNNLLQLQLTSLEDAVTTYNSEHENLSKTKKGEGDDGSTTTISMENARKALRQLGERPSSLEVNCGGGDADADADTDADADETDETKQFLLKAMTEMNDAARLAFSRAVLRAELEWDEKVKSNRRNKTEGDESLLLHSNSNRTLRTAKGGPMDRADVLEFCGLCNAVVRLPEVCRHLRDGSDIFTFSNIDDRESDLSSDRTAEKGQGDTSFKSARLPQDRLDYLQKLLLRAVGYEPQYGSEEIKRIYVLHCATHARSDETRHTHQHHRHVNSEYLEDEDVELRDAIEKSVSALSMAVTNAMLNGSVVMADSDGRLSDINEPGGVTRVVSVTYSEQMVDANGSGGVSGLETRAPAINSMEQQTEARQREELAVAREAAALQQSILGELLSMNEGDREQALEKAKEAHDSFLKRALEVPAGPERVAFIRNVEPDTQRLLVMHKLWEGMLAANAGKPPKMRNH